MNFIFLSPNFPTRYFKWVESLAGHGVTVLGIGDTPYNELHPRLLSSLTEYYFIPDLNDFHQVWEATSYFENKYGHIDYFESNNEWWLPTDAKIRDIFSIDGLKSEDMERIRKKSAMKACFEKAGIKTCRYCLVNGIQDREVALKFAEDVGYPIFAKPNIGVGAASCHRLDNDEQLISMLENGLPEEYILEEYIDGFIVSFDGICNSKGDVVFATADFFPVPIDHWVNDQSDEIYIDNPFSLPPAYAIDLKKFEEAGRKVVKSFGISKRFFHIEFFVLKSDRPNLAKRGEFIALECNMRPPGGNTPDLIDFGNSISCYEVYADVICYDENRQQNIYPDYYAFAVHRRDCYNYLHNEWEILSKYKDNLCMHGRYPDHLAVAMGNEFYYLKFSNLADAFEASSWIREK